MKQLKVAILALLLVTGFSSVNAQDENNPWSLGIGINAVDFYPTNNYGMTNPSGHNTGWYDEFSNAKDHWNFVPAISKLSIGRYIGSGFSVVIDGTFNKISKIGDKEVNDLSFWGLDAAAKWSLNSVVDLGWFEPYALGGVGYTWMGNDKDPMFNAGLGANLWFNDNIGLTIEGKLRQRFKDGGGVPAHFQYGVGITFKMGGADADGDGIYDKDDACPDVFGLAEFNGCPDTDADGIVDSEDACPNIAGLAALNGCPDTDGDGIADKDDACPKVKGTKANNGCPDTDGDGVVDSKDACPKVAGPAANKGCPWTDTDGDGVVDKDDNCPKVAGPASNKGCPKEASDEFSKIQSTFETVKFDLGKYVIKPEGKAFLDRVSETMKKYENVQYIILAAGHADNTGGKTLNLRLSDKRALAVKNYLVSKGVPESKLTTRGFGEDMPVATNNTRAGRALNRRVELKLSK